MTVRITAPSSWMEAVVDEVRPLTARISSVLLRSNLEQHEAGQHVDVRLTAPDGYQAQRSYSIASAPGSPRIELLVERLDDGEVSPYFTDVAQAGDTLEVRGPIGGHFVWRPSYAGALLLVAGGSGIAPLLSIARQWAALKSDRALTLCYSARMWEDLACIDELLALAARMPMLTCVVTTTRGPRQRDTDYDRRFDREIMGEVLRRAPQAPQHSYICGSDAFVDTVATALVDEGVAPSSIRTERFGGTG